MRYLIIGLGIYGSNLARDLTDMGHEIIGADNRKANIEAVKDYISTVYLLDATEESSLSLLPLSNVDLVIVAIGENFGASIKVVAMLKKMKVKHIYARAIDALHESILQGFDIDRIITPEQRAARDLTYELSLGAHVQSMKIDDENYVLKFEIPERYYGQKYVEIDIESNFGLKIVAVTRPTIISNILGIGQKEPKVIDWTKPDELVVPGDNLVCFGTRKSYKDMSKRLGSAG